MEQKLSILRNNLTEEQMNTVIDCNQDILCLACAGSGKSRTLAYKIAYSIALGMDPKAIVAFTFTEKAAESIKQRVAAALFEFEIPEAVAGNIFIGTIHSYCQNLLGHADAKFRQYEVLDENRFILYLISRFYTLKIDKIQKSRQKRYFETIKEIARAWSTINDENLRIEDVEREDELLGETLRLIRQNLYSDQFFDFSSIIRMTTDELEKNTPRVRKILSEIKMLLVDEYQDINPIQEKLISQLRHESCSLMVVGDDDQSIYGWRGADVKNILTFENRYIGARRHILNTNFRSSSHIVRLSDFFIKQELSTARIDKNPVSHLEGNFFDAQSLWFNSTVEEAEWVASQIQHMIGAEFFEYSPDGSVKEQRGLTPADFAILFRSIKQSHRYTNAPHRHVEFVNALSEKGIKYTVEIEEGIFDRPFAKCIREIFEILRNSSPTRGSLKNLFDTSVKPLFQFADFHLLSEVISKWNNEIHSPLGPSRKRVYPQEFYYQILEALKISQMEYDDILLRDLGTFSNILSDIEKVYVSIDGSNRYREVLNFLSNVAESGYDVGSLDIISRPDAVTVSTIHKMKGLEFPVVFLVDVVDRRFPHDNSNYNGWLPRSIMQPITNKGSYCTSRHDEARLFYTAMTRAERCLYITGNSHPEQKRAKRPSVFKNLIDSYSEKLPNNLIERINHVEQKRRVDENILPTSYTDIKTFLICPRRYQLQNLFRFNPAVPELFGFGLTVHSILERIHQKFEDAIPTNDEIQEIVSQTFHLKHIFPSNVLGVKGAYERAYEKALSICVNYVNNFSSDFLRVREDEARFEIKIGNALISGAIDLLLRKDESGNIVEAEVIDFKSLDRPDLSDKLKWMDLSLQVQLYAFASAQVLKEDPKIGSVHLLKSAGPKARVSIPISEEAIVRALDNISWAVERILELDFPMRPESSKCATCDIARICPRSPEDFCKNGLPKEILIPSNEKLNNG